MEDKILANKLMIYIEKGIAKIFTINMIIDNFLFFHYKYDNR